MPLTFINALAYCCAESIIVADRNVHFIESLDKKWVSRATFSLKFGQLGWTRCQFLLLGGSIVTGMLWSFYLVKNNKITNSWTTTKAREKIHTHLELLQFNKFFKACST